MSEQKALKHLLKDITRLMKDGKSNEGKDIMKAISESLDTKMQKLYILQEDLKTKIDTLSKKAHESGSDKDVFKLSELEFEKETLDKQITDTAIYYSQICAELDSILRMSSVQRVPLIVAPESSPFSEGITIQVLREKIVALTDRMIDYWTNYNDKDESRVEFEEILELQEHIIILRIANMRGDGACGWRAFISAVMQIMCGKQLSYDPSRMIEFIYEVKLLVFELAQILAQNPANQNFITSLMTVPENGGRKNLETYKAMLLSPDYHVTNFELRVLCVLFRLVNPQLSQVNIIHKTPLFGEFYQSISASGHIELVNKEQPTLWRVPGHFMTVLSMEGEIPRICSAGEDPISII